MNKIQIGQLLPPNQTEQNMLNTISGNLLFAGRDKKSIAVTSCHDGDGKSTVAIQLAYSITQEGNKVIVVDAALCGSSLIDYTAAESDHEKKKTFTGYLNGECKLSDIVYTTDVSNLYIIPRTKFFYDNSIPIDFASECLPSFNMVSFSNLIDDLTQTYDYIIVDTPSAGKTIEATKIASVCDGIVFVAKYKKTKKKDITEVVRQLEKSGKPIIGCVINQVKFDSIISRKRYRFLRTPLIRRIFRRKK